MTQVQRSLVLATSHLAPLVTIARAAEAAGFYRVWTTEGSGGDAIARAQLLALNTSTIKVATGIAYAFTRPPLSMAVLTGDVQEMAGGRFALGVGSGTRGVRERRYGSVFEHPAPNMAEYVHAVRAILRAQGGISFKGKFYDIEFPQFDMPHDAALVGNTELYGAALAPIMTRYMAASCDGVALHSLAVFDPYVESVTLPAIRRGAEQAGRMPRIAAWKITAVAADEDQARRAARRQLAFYFSTPSYGHVLEGTPWPQVASNIRAEAKRLQYRDWFTIGRDIPDDMVEALTIAGTAAQVREKVARVATRLGALGVDELVLQIVSGETPEETLAGVLAVIEAAKPEPNG